MTREQGETCAVARRSLERVSPAVGMNGRSVSFEILLRPGVVKACGWQNRVRLLPPAR
jgi:hypothetical protein